MARRSRKLKKSRSRGEREESYTLVVEISCRRDPELLMQIAEDAMRILEGPNADEDAKIFAQGMLCMSSAFIKIWRFLWPPSVEVEFVFDQRRYADILAENVGKFVEVQRSERVVDGRKFPSIRVDWQFWNWIKTIANAPIDAPDVIAAKYVQQRNKERALEELLQDLTLFALSTGADLNFVQ